MVTAVATVASAWALEAFATGAGVTLVASGVLADQPRSLLVVFLAASYLVWAAGLGVNLAANGRLLAATGTSASALSKALFDLARLRSATPLVQRMAASFGYVATEIAKEVPYYLGAFGASAASDGFGVAATLVFLGGANVGAGIYEFGIARLTGTYLARRSLRRRSRRRQPPLHDTYACFDTAWEPRDYLTDYYRGVEADERSTIAFFVEALRQVDPGEPILVFGVGPTLHHVFLAANAASEIHLAEYLPANLAEIERWLVGAPTAHDWSPFVRYTLECEGVVRPTTEQVREREALTRVKITALLAGDARFVDPLSGHGNAPYGTVISAYCADSATSDPATWERYLTNITGLVRPGGLFVTASLRHSTGYVVGGRTFPSASVDEADLRRVLAPRFDWADGALEVRDLAGHQAHGYGSIILAWARRNTCWKSCCNTCWSPVAGRFAWRHFRGE